MKKMILTIALLGAAAPAFAQLGGLGGLTGAAKKAQEAKQKVDDLTFSEAEERKIGEDVSAKLRERFGVVQDPAIHKYVTLVGTAVAKQSDRPNLNWTFIVLDTDGVNAFASPGGLVHVTRGALGIIKSEAELAGVLGHEIGHVTRKHTINAIKKNNMVKMGSDAAASRSAIIGQYGNVAYESILENSFDRSDEVDADRVSVELTKKAGYAPSALADFLVRLDERNKNMPERNGLFASHPETKIRIDSVRKLGAGGAGALVVPRYGSNVKYQPTPMTAIVAEDESKKKGFGVDATKKTLAPEKQSSQVTGSGGSRGVGPDRAAKGGDNPNPVKVTVSAAEVAAFIKGIA
jgi:predicted Zn-dependent protease